jgi:hypothetical protein
MSLLLVILTALFAHFFADFIMQAPFQKIMGRKSVSNLHLFNHVWIYTLSFGLILALVLGWLALPIALANGALHFVIDYFTSRGSGKCWKHGVTVRRKFRVDAKHECEIRYNQKYVGPFWCIIGFDQMLHMMVMFISFAALGVL